MRAVNLLPEDARNSGPEILTTTSVAAGAGALFLAVVVFLTLSYVQAHNRVADRDETLQALSQSVEQLQAAQAASAAGQSNDQARVAAFTAAASARMAWDDLLDDVSRVLPDGSWLTSLNMQAAAPVSVPAGTTTAVAGGSVPTTFTVSGVAFSHDVVATVMQRLARVPALSDVTLQQSTRADIGERPAYQFTMSAALRPAGVDR